MTYFSRVTILAAKLLLAVAVSSAFGVPTVSIDVDPFSSGVQDTLEVSAGNTFSVDVLIADVDVSTPINGFQFNLSFDAVVLTAVLATYGGFLLDPVYDLPPVIDNSVGNISFLSATLAPTGAVGDGVLATVATLVRNRGMAGVKEALEL